MDALTDKHEIAWAFHQQVALEKIIYTADLVRRKLIRNKTNKSKIQMYSTFSFQSPPSLSGFNNSPTIH